MSDELVDVLDSTTFLPTGEVVRKSFARKNKLIHACVHLWIFNSKGEVLLQHRSKEKKLFPSMWDISVAGGINSGEKPKAAAIREAKEEIGISINESKLKEEFTFVDTTDLGNHAGFSEIVHVFLYKCNLPVSSFVLQESEVDDVKYFSQIELKEIMESKPKDHLICSNDYFTRILDLVNSRTIKN
ncbi:MAG: NUDIX domain-containing protein [archaeon]|jgi:isopentenyldiphosphate isomerase